MKEDLNVYDNMLGLIGNTPLIKLNKITSNFKGSFYAKVEGFNPGHSTKDRIALYIIEELEPIIEEHCKIHSYQSNELFRIFF